VCVIVIAEKTRPSPAQIEAMFETNKDGFGIAQRVGDSKVEWIKGLIDLKEAQELIAKAPLPFVCHFRIQTVGGRRQDCVIPSLCRMMSPSQLKERLRDLSFFIMDTGSMAIKCHGSRVQGQLKLPKGKWSDPVQWRGVQHSLVLQF